MQMYHYWLALESQRVQHGWNDRSLVYSGFISHNEIHYSEVAQAIVPEPDIPSPAKTQALYFKLTDPSGAILAWRDGNTTQAP
jgi:hypothetical protein